MLLLAILKFIVCPLAHVVPAATGWTADHMPLAHCWKEVPPMQFHMPSEVQAPVSPPAVEPDEEEEEELEDEEAEPVDAATAGTDTDVATAPPEAAPAEPEPVANTPGAADSATAEDVTAGADEEAAPEPAPAPEEPEPEEPVAAGALAAPQEAPVGGSGFMVAIPSCSSESPGSGNARSPLSVPQPFPIFATNISGRAEKAA